MRTLRSRLLLSYLAIILTTLLMVAIALFAFATISSVRLTPILQRLAAVSRTNQNEIVQLWQAGGSGEQLQNLLLTTSEQTGVRILVTESESAEIIFDTEQEDDWVGDQIAGIDRPTGLILPNAGRASIFGSFTHSNGSQWLVFAEPNREFGRVLIFYGLTEPTAAEFFNDFFLRPLAYAGALAILLAVLLAIAITRSVAGPLDKLAAAAEGIAGGDYDQRVEPQGPNEVQRVAGSFNSMAAQVKATQAAQRDFVANVSHDLKTPLTAISGWSQALLDGAAATPEERRRATETIHTEAGRMSRMVNDLLDLARIESGQFHLSPRAVDLGQVMEDVYRASQPRAELKQIELRLNRTEVPVVSGDPDRLVQVFTNLVDNALTYTPSGGQVEMSVRHGDSWVEGIVRDNGTGIAENELPRVFERFYRLEKSRARVEDGRGSGLGLAIVRELVAAHGGQVQVTSELGRGTAFVVRIPVGNPIPDS
ncbi:MAG: ATP-binding protein [Chloroflexota bacterium]|jgi:two-component system, OmpR family, sensor kinase